MYLSLPRTTPVALPMLRLGMFFAASLFFTAAPRTLRADEPTYTQKVDVIYRRKFGMALTLDVVTPREHANGLGIIYIVSGGWHSSHDLGGLKFVFKQFTDRGYTVFAVVHGSQPKFTIPECVDDLRRAVRFVRYHAHDYGVDPDRLGVCGTSAGGHLSLMMGVAGDNGNPEAKDPVDRAPSRVRAVACFYPPTDFLNYGKEGEIAIGRGTLIDYQAPFDFHEFDPKSKKFVKITDENRILELGRQISPITHVSSDDAPTLIFHGDKDLLVPMQQSELVVDKLQKNGVEAKLVVHPGAQHGWPEMHKEWTLALDWFDQHLKPASKPAN